MPDTTIKLDELHIENDLGDAQVGDYFLGNRGILPTGTMTFAPRLDQDPTPSLANDLDLDGHNIDNVTATQISYLENITSDVQAQIDAGKTTLGTVTTGVWHASTIEVPYGGSGRTSATAYTPIVGGTISTGPHQSMASAGSAGQIMQSAGSSAVPVWSTATYPSTASTLNKRLKSDGTNLVMSTTTMPDTGTSGKVIRGDGTNYVESTSSFADTYTASNLLYSNGANNVTGLATANSSVLVTDGSGVPSLTTDIPTAVTIGGAAIYRVGGTDVAVADGGTGRSSHTAYAVLCGGTTATGAQQSVASLGTSGQILTSNGAGALPTFQNAPGAVAATQADQEAGSSNTVFTNPLVQQYHPSAAKVWVKYTSITTTTIQASYNVSSLTDGGTGVTTVNYTVAFSSANYAALADGNQSGTGQGGIVTVLATTSSVVTQFTPSTLAVADGLMSFVAFGDQ